MRETIKIDGEILVKDEWGNQYSIGSLHDEDGGLIVRVLQTKSGHYSAMTIRPMDSNTVIIRPERK